MHTECSFGSALAIAYLSYCRDTSPSIVSSPLCKSMQSCIATVIAIYDCTRHQTAILDKNTFVFTEFLYKREIKFEDDFISYELKDTAGGVLFVICD